MSARRRRRPVETATTPPSTVLRWRLILQTGMFMIFGVFLAISLNFGGGLNIIVGFLGVLGAIGGGVDAVMGHRYETSLLRQIANHSYRASYAEAELARHQRLRVNQGPVFSGPATEGVEQAWPPVRPIARRS